MEKRVRLAIFADIHANRQAFDACLEAARAHGAERMVLLGDYVGYGADPEWSVEAVMDLVDAGALAVGGNHDEAVSNRSDTMNAEAQAAIASRLDAERWSGPLRWQSCGGPVRFKPYFRHRG